MCTPDGSAVSSLTWRHRHSLFPVIALVAVVVRGQWRLKRSSAATANDDTLHGNEGDGAGKAASTSYGTYADDDASLAAHTTSDRERGVARHCHPSACASDDNDRSSDVDDQSPRHRHTRRRVGGGGGVEVDDDGCGGDWQVFVADGDRGLGHPAASTRRQVQDAGDDTGSDWEIAAASASAATTADPATGTSLCTL